MDSRFPSRTTLARGAESRLSLSMVCLLRSCWMMPMPVLAAAISRNSISSKEPTAISRAARTMKMKLKKVHTFSRTICPTLLVGDSTAVLAQPARWRSCTCSMVRPWVGSGVTRGTSCRGRGCSGTVGLRSFFFMLMPLASSDFRTPPFACVRSNAG